MLFFQGLVLAAFGTSWLLVAALGFSLNSASGVILSSAITLWVLQGFVATCIASFQLYGSYWKVFSLPVEYVLLIGMGPLTLAQLIASAIAVRTWRFARRVQIAPIAK